MDDYDNDGLVDIVTSTLDPCSLPDYFHIDRFPDFYLGPCYPRYEAVTPNRMYRNEGREDFVDDTFSGGVSAI